MLKNTSGQKITVLVIDTFTNTPKIGDGSNLSLYVSIDDGPVTLLTDTTATEIDSSNAKGLYSFDLTQAETNGNKLIFSGNSTTANVVIVPSIVSPIFSVDSGAGSTPYEITIKTSGGVPISGVEVWISTDAAGNNIVAGTLYTNDAGLVTFMLDSGTTYYMFRDHHSYQWTNPVSFVVP